MWSDGKVVNNLKAQWHLILKQKMSVACFRNDGSDTIVGVNIMGVMRKDDVFSRMVPKVRKIAKLHNSTRTLNCFSVLIIKDFKHKIEQVETTE